LEVQAGIRLMAAVAVMALVTSCAGMQPRRTVEGNRFYSTAAPRIAVEVCPRFEYVPAGRQTLFASMQEGFYFTSSPFVFQDKHAQEIIAIDTYKAPQGQYFLAHQFFEQTRPLYRKAKVVLAGKTFHTACYLHECLLTHVMLHVTGPQDNILFWIGHFKRLPPDPCRRWQTVQSLSGPQIQRVDRFIASGNRCIQISNAAAIPP
jgi:hypothetical protein